MEDLVRTLLVPTERPVLSIDVKRALLLFDQVHIFAPDDRDFMAPADFTRALTRPRIGEAVLGDQSGVLQLGKVPRYDETFQQTLDECDEAIKNGSLVVRPTPIQFAARLTLPPGALQSSVIGMRIVGDRMMVAHGGGQPDPTFGGGGWQDPTWVLARLQSFLCNAEFLRSAFPRFSRAELDQYDPASLAPRARALFEGPSGAPRIADIDAGDLAPEHAQTILNLGAARLGSAIRTIGKCDVDGLYPFSTDPGISDLLAFIQRISSETIAGCLTEVDRSDGFRRAMRVERIIYEQEVPAGKLELLPISEILVLRRRYFAPLAAARERFFDLIKELSLDSKSDDDFDTKVRAELDSYRIAQREISNAIARWGVRAGFKAALALAATETNVIQTALGIGSWKAAVLISGVIAVLNKHQELPIDVFSIWQDSRQAKRSAAKVLLGPYTPFLP